LAARYGVIGAGILGLAVARRLLEAQPGCHVAVLEKEDRVARHQTGHNSGVVHAGIYYTPGSEKARLCRRGRDQLRELCERHGLTYHACGKIVVACEAAELGRLDELERRATANGVPGLRRLGPAGLREIEPHVAGLVTLHSPATAIVDYVAVSEALADEVREGGGELRLSWPVTDTSVRSTSVAVCSTTGEERFDWIVVCGGLQTDRIARWAGDTFDPAIVPFRGEYYRLVPERAWLVRGLIYPVPDPAYPFLGVHFTRRVSGDVDIGPNAVIALAREGYRRRDVCLADVVAVARDLGFWRFVRRHWRTGVRELWVLRSKRAYLERARRYLPELEPEDVVPAPAGVRAQALARDGSLVDDFSFGRTGRVLAVRNAPSPSSTSSLAIAEVVVDRLRAGEGFS
jgi:L-2-hydroxyglutarate oxidase LhgO